MSVEGFVKGKRMTDLRPNEIVTETSFPELAVNSTCSFEKVGMRNSLIIAFVNCATYLKLSKDTGTIEEIRIALNRTSGKIPQRARKTETMLKNKRIDEQTLTDAAAALRSELKLSSDFRVSEEYRSEVACVLLKRALLNCAKKISGEKIIV